MTPEEAEARIAELERLVYVPGLWRCAKCACQVMSSTLNASTGQVGANHEPQTCPNNCGPMWRVTEREAGNRLCDQQDIVAAQSHRAGFLACREIAAAFARAHKGKSVRDHQSARKAAGLRVYPDEWTVDSGDLKYDQAVDDIVAAILALEPEPTS